MRSFSFVVGPLTCLFMWTTIFGCSQTSEKSEAQPSTPNSTGPTQDVSQQPIGPVSGPTVGKYPIILQHGFLAGERAGFFSGVREHLTLKGYRVFEAEVSAANTVAFRAQQLSEQVNIVLQRTGASKVNIIAHSMGGLDGRYLISTLHFGGKVASLSTLSTPHRGTPYADYVLDNTNGRQQDRLANFMNIFGSLVNNSTSTNDADARAAVGNLTEAFVNGSFNVQNSDDVNVFYQSWAAESGPGTQDRMKATMRSSWDVIYNARGANDGLVPISSAKWGEFRGTLVADHLDVIGIHFLDLASPFEHLPFFEELARGLTQKGF